MWENWGHVVYSISLFLGWRCSSLVHLPSTSKALDISHQHGKLKKKKSLSYSLSKIVINIYLEFRCEPLYMQQTGHERDKYPMFVKLIFYLQRLVIQI